MSLDPILLLRILTIALAIKLKLRIRIDDLVSLLIERFNKLYLIVDLKVAFKKVLEI